MVTAVTLFVNVILIPLLIDYLITFEDFKSKSER